MDLVTEWTMGAATGSRVATLIATVERFARYHLAVVYTGLTLQTTQEGDLCTAMVSASADPALRLIRGDVVDELVRRRSQTAGSLAAEFTSVCELAKAKKLPPGAPELVRREISGDGWALVTFAVAAQRWYATLSRGLTVSTRRVSRDHAVGASTPLPELPADLGVRKLIAFISEQDGPGLSFPLHSAIGAVVMATDEIRRGGAPPDVSNPGRSGLRKSQTQSGEKPRNVSYGESDAVMAVPSSSNAVDKAAPVKGSRDLDAERRTVLATATDVVKLQEAIEMAYDFILEENRKNAVRTAALDSWNTFCSLIHLLASCPGLSTDSSSTLQPSLFLPLNDGWSNRDLQRSSQAIVIAVVSDILAQHPRMLMGGRSQDIVVSDSDYRVPVSHISHFKQFPKVDTRRSEPRIWKSTSCQSSCGSSQF